MLTFLLVGGILTLLLVKKLFNRRTTANILSATQGCNSSTSSGWGDYEVFLSFRGEDTRTNFTDHLYNALVDRGIHTFRDKEGLRIGEKMDMELRSVIHQSKIAIPIFSKHYASSKWCLRELAEIVECMKQEDQGHITVMPVFYHVDPSDVRNQTGCYKKAFQNHQKKFGRETEEWKKALKEIGDLKGWDLMKIANGHEGELIKLIAEEVWSELRKSPLIVSDTLVGIDSHREEMMKLLKIESKDTRIVVGIHGLGGIGKTTIARCVYNAIYHDFDGRCSFISDARETFQMKGPVHLQSQLLSNILNLEDPKITSVDHGIHMIRQRLSNKRVLIVFDDVDFDLNAIIRKHDWLSCGSRIIITSRDRHILGVFGVDKTYEPSEMDPNQSLQLFSLHAFKRDQPPEHYLDLSKEVVRTTGGLPLALEVIGSSLFGIKESSIWKEMAKKLKKILHHDVVKKLKISYAGLDRVERELFLDIACFFIGMDKNTVYYICDACELFPETGFNILCRKSLVKIGEKNEVRMHDLLRDLGREIVYEENPKNHGERSRLWSCKEALDVLRTQTGTRKVEGLSIKFQSIDIPERSMSEGFAAMTNLRLLQLDHTVVSENIVHSFSELRWLSWKGCWNIKLTPTNPRNLAVLDLSFGGITENWIGWSYIKVAENLKVLDLTCSSKLSQTPDLSANLKLEKLILEDCEQLATIDDSIGNLKGLVVLNVKGCMKLKNLPTSICELRSLKILDIRFTNISQLPEKLGCMKALTELLIDHTPIEQLPNSIGDLRNLKYLSADNCKIKEGGIPDVIGRLCSLENLSLNRNQFHTLPAAISRLSLLQSLCLDGCDKLQSLPPLSNLTNLNGLWLGGNKSLTELPISMNAITRLESLSIISCHALQHISHLPPGLTRLSVAFCENVTEISGLLDMRNLQVLILQSCPRLAKIESLEGLDSLQMCQINSCPSLNKLPNLRGLKKLRDLTFIDVGLVVIEGLEGLYSLKNLFIWRCHLLRKIPKLLFSEIEGLEELESLEEITIHDCGKLIEVPIVDRLKSLERLLVYNCGSLEILPDLSNLTKLVTLSIRGCKKLTEIQGVDRLEILEKLSIDGCVSIEALPCLSRLRKLKSVSAVYCTRLTQIQGVGELESLEKLCIDMCISIETLPSLSRLRKLKFLSAVNCKKLTVIEGLDELEYVQLNVNGCTFMDLPVETNDE